MEQVAIEAAQMYLTEEGKSPFASTVRFRNHLWIFFVALLTYFGINPLKVTDFEMEL